IAGVEIEQAGTKVRVEGKPAPAPSQVFTSYMPGDSRSEHPGMQQMPPAAPVTTPAEQAEPTRVAAKKVEDDIEAGMHIITSPIVGTFYRSPNPEAKMFVNVGDSVSKGKVLCIIEAMKLMNEIESDVGGTITRIYPQNGQPVEYGEKLFAIKV
ncbi:MAG: acetyl-CoA carboxylase biotin carboxyl carrier protein, partial [Acidobacteriota bacterium]|nr:acetyl-CoA carboxylase biotin carboxyl carrier protein [Acidobacteriota bacterium]